MPPAALVYLIPQGNSIKMFSSFILGSFIQVFPVLLWKHSPSLKPPTEHCELHTGLDYVLGTQWASWEGRAGKQHVSPGQRANTQFPYTCDWIPISRARPSLNSMGQNIFIKTKLNPRCPGFCTGGLSTWQGGLLLEETQVDYKAVPLSWVHYVSSFFL